MNRVFDRLPLFVLLMGASAGSMIPVALYAVSMQDYYNGRVFFYSALLVGVFTALVGIATVNNARRESIHDLLLGLIGVYVFLPLLLAVPFYESLRAQEALNQIRPIDAWFEMLSSLTTTGASLFQPWEMKEAAHLWRAIVGWMGGFMIWVGAIAVLAPLNLGGFEVTSRGNFFGAGAYFAQVGRTATARQRLLRHARDLAPIYGGLTFALFVCLTIVGEDRFVAACHAMSTMATSGISPLKTFSTTESGFYGEALIFIFLFFAISRLTFAPETQSSSMARLSRDPEFRMALLAVVILPFLLFMRHWIAAYDVNGDNNMLTALRAFWGGAFTVLSFLSTNGFVSAEWQSARIWSGLEAPGLILVGLALIGGGVATTAGGVKLLRVHALSRHGLREIQRLSHPSSVQGSGGEDRHVRNQGARIAWVFFMLFAISVAMLTIILSLLGVTFDTALILTIAALSNTGPLARAAADPAISYAALSDGAQVVLAGAMIIGRIETLAIIALIGARIWRN